MTNTDITPRQIETAATTTRTGQFQNGRTFEIITSYGCFWINIDGEEETSTYTTRADFDAAQRDADIDDQLATLALYNGGIK